MVKKVPYFNIEKALYVNDTDALARIKETRIFTRLYFGVEFCEQKIPSVRELQHALEFCKKKKLNLTLVTPYVTNKGIEKIEPLFDFLNTKGEYEIVVNDFGVLEMIKNMRNRFKTILGRLLTKQKKDPRINSIEDSHLKDYFAKSILDNISFCDFVKKQKISRVEMDNVLHGIHLNKGFTYSLYYPYVYLTTSMQCFVDNCELCKDVQFRLRNKYMGKELFIKGKTQFFINKDLHLLRNSMFDRLVVQKSLPY